MLHPLSCSPHILRLILSDRTDLHDAESDHQRWCMRLLSLSRTNMQGAKGIEAF